MSDLEAQVAAILEIMVNATVTEITEVIGGSDSTHSEVASCTPGSTRGSSADTVR